ncbi:MAG: sigma 54-interacting transcriptional regulator [Desulfarculus sp.]|nr:sigma 54-interacting transcriptional regulator [Desulfarculus sp.]
MPPWDSLRTRLLAGVMALVLLASLGVSLLVSQRYAASLRAELTAQAQSVAQALALQASDKVLVNDLVGLQTMLDHQMSSDPNLAYLFVVRDQRVLAHTFAQGMPMELAAANQPQDAGPHQRRIASQDGHVYLDLAWPIFEGKAGFLRVGWSESSYQGRLERLWWEMALLTLGVLFLAVAAAMLFVHRLTKPLAALSRATQALDQGNLKVSVPVEGVGEVRHLAAAFQIVPGVGSQANLDAMAGFLVRRLGGMVDAGALCLVLTGPSEDRLHLLEADGCRTVENPEQVRAAHQVLAGLNGIVSSANPWLPSPPLAPAFQAPGRHSLVPLRHEGVARGALVLACPRDCRCEEQDLSLLELSLGQAAGVIMRALAHGQELERLRARVSGGSDYQGIVGKDPKMRQVFSLLEEVAPSEAAVLIEGESGTGKELVARAIHQKSRRADKPFVVINCAAYPQTLLESELFGHEKGAFTGAARQKAGRFELADGGTIFLDEVGEIPLPAQVRLLRVLQDQRFERVGGERTLKVNVRVLAATNKNLLAEVRAGRFRDDLYYRLNVIPIHLPPLRERPGDVPLLARHFLRLFAGQQGKAVEDFSREALRLLLDYPWPGNVRELQNSVEHAVVLAKGSQVLPADLPASLRLPAPSASPTIAGHERRLLEETLAACGWNKKLAAQRLGISRSALYQKLKRHGLDEPTSH